MVIDIFGKEIFVNLSEDVSKVGGGGRGVDNK